MRQDNLADLEALSLKARRHVVTMCRYGGAFIGSALSCIDLIAYLYGVFLDFDAIRSRDPERDYFFLSKGHAVPALYGTFTALGILPPERLRGHTRPIDNLYWHPSSLVAGIEFHAGSLGHLLPVALGVALDCSLSRSRSRVVVLTGDGELNEGTNWEALLVAHARGLDNLTVVVDRNGMQANRRTEDLVPLEPLATKIEAFGCSVLTVDGHDFGDIDHAFSSLPFEPGIPSVIIAETVRGKGIPSIEGRLDRWFCSLTDADMERMITELEENYLTHVSASTAGVVR